MNILIAPDSFKGTLSSRQIIDIVSAQANIHFPGCHITGLPIADGGEGTVHAVLQSRQGTLETVTVSNPLLQPIDASYGILNASPMDKGTGSGLAGSAEASSAIIEMAAASGITLIPAAPGQALLTSSYGTGELIADALKKGCRDITVAVGGSATNDGGGGAMAALGFRFLDEQEKEIIPTGGNLIHIRRIDASRVMPELKAASFTVMCDVRNPFAGADGATYTYGPQKGALEEHLEILEEGMVHFAEVIKQDLGKDILHMPGAGAAGGLGGALYAFLGGSLKSGIQTMLNLVYFDRLAAKADLIVTGEGMADGQSAKGKVLWGIGQRAKAARVPVLALVGGMKPEAKELYQCGITAFVPALNRALPLAEILPQAEALLADAAERAFLLVKMGMGIH